MNKKIFLLFLCLPSLLLASDDFGCGKYSVRGLIRVGEKGFEIVINEKTMSEHVITLSTTDEAKVAIFLNNSITAEVHINTKSNGTIVQAHKVISIKERIPDPLAPEDTGFKLIKKSRCLVK